MSKSLHGFRYLSVAEQTAKTLAEAIGNGEISDLLPGEMELSARLKVSRPTLRRAIAILSCQNLVVTAKGKRTRVVRGRGRRKEPRAASVCFVVCLSPGSHLIKVNSLFDEVKAALTAEGVVWDEIYKSQLGERKMKERLREIVASHKRSCYVLLNSPRLVQQWFAQSGEPVLVMGSCHEGIDLPSIDLDYHAVGWHAGGQFIKNGHRSVLLIEPEERAAGVGATEAGLKKYMAGVADTHVRVLRTHPDSFLDSFEWALRGPTTPTAALVCRMEMVLSALGAAQRFGRCIPQDFSLISRDDYHVFEFMAPQVTRYRCNLHAMARKTIRLIHSLIRKVTPDNRTTLIVPDFLAGQTLQPRQART